MRLISVIRPELKKEWDEERNIVNFDEVTTGHKKYWWICSKNTEHKWEATATHRAVNGSNCPYCANKLPTKETCLATLSPHLIHEWHEKNKKTPCDYLNYSAKKVWWKCAQGHEWEARIRWRTGRGNGCPKCKSSKGEKIIENFLKELGIEYVHQYSVKMGDSSWPRFFDFYIPSLKLFIEIHGLQHFKETKIYSKSLIERQEIDRQKQEYAEQHGHYMMVDYREHDPELALERFREQFSKI
ncbi:zinc-ribbon domain-containing protein [Bacillus sp. S35]|nr:zinc-ribbon domain-containing protein [Bacillus sp. S35]